MNSTIWDLGVSSGMEKVAIKVPVMHGTNQQWDTLKAGVGKAIAAGDPNPRAVYMATKGRQLKPGVEGFARAATKQRGGSPTVAHAKVDTAKGWKPRTLTSWGQKNIGSMDDAHDLVDDLHHGGSKGGARGELWKRLMKGISTWHHPDASKSVKPTRYRPVSSAAPV